MPTRPQMLGSKVDNFKVCLSTEMDIHLDTRKTNLESFPETRKNILEKQGQRD